MHCKYYDKKFSYIYLYRNINKWMKLTTSINIVKERLPSILVTFDNKKEVDDFVLKSECAPK